MLFQPTPLLSFPIALPLGVRQLITVVSECPQFSLATPVPLSKWPGSHLGTPPGEETQHQLGVSGVYLSHQAACSPGQGLSLFTRSEVGVWAVKSSGLG